MANKKKKTVTQLGKQPPLYRFFLKSVSGRAVYELSAVYKQTDRGLGER